MTADIAVIGDSYVESPQVSSAVLMTTVLGLLQKSTVANFGLSGYGPQQELAVLKRYALNLHPKTIVWVFYEGNDLDNVYAYEETLAKLPVSHAVYPWWQRSFIRNALSFLLSLREKCTPSRRLMEKYGTVRDAEGRHMRVYFPESEAGKALTVRKIVALNKTGTVLAAAYQLCRERGVRLVVVFAPTRYRVYHGLTKLGEVSEEVKQWVVNDLPERFRAMVADIGADIDYLDLTPIFKAKEEQGTVIFLPDDIHWTPAGQRSVAEALDRYLSTIAQNR